MNKHSQLFRSLAMLVCAFMLLGSFSIASYADIVQDLSANFALDENVLAADKYIVYNSKHNGDADVRGEELGVDPITITLDSPDDLFYADNGNATTALIADESQWTNDPEEIAKIGKLMPVTLEGTAEAGVDSIAQKQTGLYLPAYNLVEKDGSTVQESNYVSVKVQIPKTGRYAIRIEYYPIVDYTFDGDVSTPKSGSAIERTLYIDGIIPFYESRFLTFTRTYQDIMGDGDGEWDGSREDAYVKDIAENEMRPDKVQTPRWMSAYFADSTAINVDPFEYYMEEGEHILTLASQREPVVISKIELLPYIGQISYDEYVDKYDEGKVSTDAIKLEGELYTNTSDRSIYPLSDRASAITSPQNASRQLLNMMGEENWKNCGQWASWVVDAPESGYYKIAVRYRQSINDGLFSSRVLRVNGEIPFEEAKYLQFDYGDVWQTCYLNNGSEEYADGFLIYLKEGKNTISLEANMGNMAEIIGELNQIITTINASYIDILKITGNQPDANRDYGFYGLIPASIDALADASDDLYDLAARLTAISGKSSSITTLENVARRLDKMGNKEDEVAKNMSGLKGDIGSLGTWLQTAMTQPLSIDYISIQSGEDGAEELPKANEGMLESLWYEVRMFGISFVADYNTLGVMEEISEDESVIVWTSAGRDQMKIIRNLVNKFSNKTNVAVSLKLTVGGSLLPSILAGVGPDVTLDSVDIIDWAIRGAIQPLGNVGTGEEYYEGFNDLYFGKLRSDGTREESEFPSAAFVPLTLYTDDIKNYSFEEHGKIEEYDAVVYGLPNTLDFPMMFYREDVFQSMDLPIPKVWNDFYDILPILQNNQMQVVFPISQAGTNLFLYQKLAPGSDPANVNALYADNGRRINLDSDLALTAFDELCNLFTQYKLPVAPNFENQFRTGDIPLGIIGYSTYTQLSVFAPEIRGLWKFVPIPGFEYTDENGNTKINNSAVATVSSIVMPRGERSDEKAQNAFNFMAWYVGAENQSDYANEYSAWMGQNTKYNTANKRALEDMNWTTEEKNMIAAQMEMLVGVPDYPGSYIITRNLTNAFMNVYNNNQDPVTTMLDYIVDINKEISRKRREFDLDAFEISYTNTFTESKK